MISFGDIEVKYAVSYYRILSLAPTKRSLMEYNRTAILIPYIGFSTLCNLQCTCLILTHPHRTRWPKVLGKYEDREMWRSVKNQIHWYNELGGQDSHDVFPLVWFLTDPHIVSIILPSELPPYIRRSRWKRSFRRNRAWRRKIGKWREERV